MNYDFVADKIEVRSIKDGTNPKYIVKGTALMSNKKDIYEYQKRPDGSIRTLKSMFTPHCLESIRQQAKHKRLFVDAQHELALNTNIKSILKGKLSPEEEKRIGIMLKTKMLPLAKLNSIEIEDDSLKIETELNPMFREVDTDHQKYFDAVWYSLENKYLNGLSANFANPKVISNKDDEMIIDEIDVLGFSYMDNPALHENSIYEVAIRAMQEGINTRMGENMADTNTNEKDKLNAEKARFEDEKKQFEQQKTEFEKTKQEDAKKAELEKQAEGQKKIETDLAEKAEALKQAEEEKQKLQDELNSVKGQVAQTSPPAQNTDAGDATYDDKFYEEKLKNITKEHDETIALKKQGKEPLVDNTMRGFAELVNLQSKVSRTAGMDKKDAEYAEEHHLFEAGDSDVVVKRK